MSTEIGFDGGTVKISKDGGATGSPSLRRRTSSTRRRSLATAAAGNTNPLEGQPGFTGTDGDETQSDWGTSIIDLSDLALAVANGERDQGALRHRS